MFKKISSSSDTQTLLCEHEMTVKNTLHMTSFNEFTFNQNFKSKNQRVTIHDFITNIVFFLINALQRADPAEARSSKIPIFFTIL